MRTLGWALLLAGCSTSRPEGVAGPEADAIAQKMMAAVGGEAWQNTAAVQWTFAGRNRHLWDKSRHYALVEWDSTRALIDINQNIGRAYVDNQELRDDDARSTLDDAHARWTNDAFWLNPVVKAFDSGTVRQIVTEGDATGILVIYQTGGRTPGDAYLWWLGEDYVPKAWQMWTSNLPVAGAKASWDRWITLTTGAKISTLHQTSVFDLELTNVQGRASLAELIEPDPFAPLAECPARCTRF